MPAGENSVKENSSIFDPAVRILARLVGLTARALWKGTLAARMLALGAIVMVVLVSAQAGLYAVSQLASAGLVLAALIVVYGLIIRGRR